MSVLISWTEEETEPHLKLLYEVWYQDTKICLVVLEKSLLCKFPASSTNHLLDGSGCLFFLSLLALCFWVQFQVSPEKLSGLGTNRKSTLSFTYCPFWASPVAQW